MAELRAVGRYVSGRYALAVRRGDRTARVLQLERALYKVERSGATDTSVTTRREALHLAMEHVG